MYLRTLVFTFLIISSFLFSCSQPAESPDELGAEESAGDASKFVSSEALDTASRKLSDGFTKLDPQAAGLNFFNKADSTQVKVDQIAAQAGLGTADIDADGDIDIYVCGIESGNRLFRNEGGFQFSDITAEVGADIALENSYSSSATFIDVDADGDQDLYVSLRAEENLLFINDGSGKFSEEAEARGAHVGLSTVSTAAFDADGDGDIDLYVANNRENRRVRGLGLSDMNEAEVHKDPETQEVRLVGQSAEKYYFDNIGKIHVKPEYDNLLINDGNGHFHDGTEAAGIRYFGWTLQPLAADFNDDGFTDLLLSGDFETPDYYYINNGDGTFSYRSQDKLRKTCWFSMGSDAGDLNRDGLLDAFVGDMALNDPHDSKLASGDMHATRQELLYYEPQQMMRNMLYVNRGEGWMTEIAEFAGVQATEWTWSCRIADFDSDGMNDLFATNGYMAGYNVNVDALNELTKMRLAGAGDAEQEEYMLSFGALMTDDVVFRQHAELKFERKSAEWGINDGAVSVGCSIQDFDMDGDLDIIVNQSNDYLAIWRNDIDCGNSAMIQLSQEGLNPEGIGAKVSLFCGEDRFTNEIIKTRGYASSEACRLHFGLGGHEKIDRIEVRWPDRAVQIVEDQPVNSLLKISRDPDVNPPSGTELQTMFTATELPWERKEQETIAAEYAAEPLLPMLRSTLGGGVAVGDYNGDGILDAYICGPAGQSGSLFEGRGEGRFIIDPRISGLIPEAAEEMSALWADVNSDGRLDLIVGCGGNESVDNSLLADYLLINEENGFKAHKLPTSRLSSGSICMADVNADGNLDMFIAGRMLPYEFMATAKSALLLGDGAGNFTDGSSALPDALHGNISEAQFADMDEDGKVELLLAKEFGHIEIWSHSDGKFNAVQQVGKLGMWNGLAVAELNGDSRLDIVAANWGMNNKYGAKQKKPYLLAVKDYDGNGSRDLVEIKYTSEGMLPGRGRSCSGYAIGYIPQKFPTWKEFSMASFEDVYGSLDEADAVFRAEDMHSAVFLQDGEDWKYEALPLSAQFAPVFGTAVGDFNEDGRPDLLLLGNLRDTQPETGRWNQGYGQLLLGKAEGGFSAPEPSESGVRVFRDARGLISCDLDGNGSLDALAVISDGAPHVMLNSSSATLLTVKLSGRGGNLAAIGSTLRVSLDSGDVLVSPVQAGQGYLSGYSGPQQFVIPDGATAQSIEVTWPDGSLSEATVSGDSVELSW